MTHISISQIHTPRNLIRIRWAITASRRAAAGFASIIGGTFAALPGAISRVFAMAYVDPFTMLGRVSERERERY